MANILNSNKSAWVNKFFFIIKIYHEILPVRLVFLKHGLFTLLNGTSNLMGYEMPKSSLWKESRGNIWLIAGVGYRIKFRRLDVIGHTAALFVDWSFQDLFTAACSILVLFQSSFFFRCFVKVQVVQPYSSTDTATTWKNSRFILWERSHFHLVVNVSIAIYAYVNIVFSWWDIVTKVYELIHPFQKFAD